MTIQQKLSRKAEKDQRSGQSAAPPGPLVLPASTADSPPQSQIADPPDANRGGPSSQKIACGGVDTLDASCWLSWDLRRFKVAKNALEFFTRISKTKEGKNNPPYFTTDDGDKLQVRPSGGKAGEVYFSWMVKSPEGIVIQLQDRTEATGDRPNARVHIGAVPLINHGHDECWKRAVALLNRLGADVRRNTHSRGDIAIDIIGQDAGVYTRALMADRYLCRGQKGEQFAEHKIEELGEDVYYRRDKFTGFSIGTGPVRLRLYDKVEELKTNPLKRQIMEEVRWGCKPDRAARAEIQLRREALRKQGVDTVEDFLILLPDIAKYYFCKWYVQTVGVPDRKNKNQSRAKVAAPWRRVQEIAEATFGEGKLKPAVRQRQETDVDAIDAAIRGLIAKRIALRHDPENWDSESLVRQHLGEVLEHQVEEIYSSSIAKRSGLIHDGYGPQLGEFHSDGPDEVRNG